VEEVGPSCLVEVEDPSCQEEVVDLVEVDRLVVEGVVGHRLEDQEEVVGQEVVVDREVVVVREEVGREVQLVKW
jgi:hypothetical protein